MLAAGGGNFRKFKGRCHNCGKYGHKAYHCKDGENKDNKNNNNNNKNSQTRNTIFKVVADFAIFMGTKKRIVVIKSGHKTKKQPILRQKAQVKVSPSSGEPVMMLKILLF